MDATILRLCTAICVGTALGACGGGSDKSAEITATATDGGTIFPARAVVTRGSSATFRIVVDEGHELASVSGCGGSLSGDRYTTGPVTAACTVTATFVAAPLKISLGLAYVTQSIQRPDRGVPLVAGRPALLRVVPVANQANDAKPRLRIKFFDGETLVRADFLDARAPVRQALEEGQSAWDLALAPADIRPGARLAVKVDPDGLHGAGPDEEILSLEAVDVPPFRARAVPVSIDGALPNLTASDGDALFDLFLRMFPVAAHDIDVREPYTFARNADPDRVRPPPSEVMLLNELSQLRTADASGRYYYGVIEVNEAIRDEFQDRLGRALLGGPVSFGAVGNTETAAHELGHNLGLRHAPCGNPPAPDPSFPYANGRIGAWGWDRSTGALHHPGTNEIMSYCRPNIWISDEYYTRAVDALRNPPPVVIGIDAAPSLLIPGVLSGGTVTLTPGYTALAAPPAIDDGPFTAELRDTDGVVIATRRFAVAEVADGADDERIFAVAFPYAIAQRAASALIHAGNDIVELRSTGAAFRKTVPGASAVRADADRVRVRWDADAYPLAVVRNGLTGNILSFARGGDALIFTRSGTLHVSFSDGLHTVDAAIAVD